MLEEIMSKLSSENTCFYSEQDRFSFFRYLNIENLKIYETIILLGFYMGVKLGISCTGRIWAEDFRE